MTSVAVEEAQSGLPELIARLKPGETVMIRQGDKTVASLVGASPATSEPRRPGSAVGRLEILAEDDEHLADFQEYMP